MQIAKHKVVTVDYTLTDDEGTVLDSSKDAEPLAYIQGVGQIIPGLENALEGKAEGDTLQVSVSPEEAYGDRDDKLLEVVPRDRFNVDDVSVGMQFHAQTPDGQTQFVTVVSVENDEVVVDGNHPLAGVNLNFDVKVVGVRDASAEELDHGHVHGPGGHTHE